MTRKTDKIKGTLVKAYIMMDETLPVSLIQFEPTNVLLSFIKITIILQHTGCYMFQASLAHHREHTIVHNRCLTFYACSRAVKNFNIIHMQYTEVRIENSNQSSSLFWVSRKLHIYYIYYIEVFIGY